MVEEYLNVKQSAALAPDAGWRPIAGRPAEATPERHVLHTITGSTMGGAEMMLYRLLARGDRTRFAPTVLSLLRPGPVGERMRALGVPVQTLGLRREQPLSPALLKLVGIARSLRPTLIQGWMYHGNLVANLCTLLVGRRLPVIWNVRHSICDLRHETLLTRGIIRAGAALSSSPRAIIYNSRRGAAQHEALGFDPAKTVVIPNGFDCQLFRPRPGLRQRLCQQAGIPESATIVGMIARNHPQKDPGNLIRATALLAGRGVPLHVVIVGPGFDPGNGELARALQQAGVAERVSLLGQRHDIPDVVAGLDIATLPSAWGEGFPNVLGEAMASGVPCVATDVGDSAWIVGRAGLVVPARDPEALAEALGRLIALGPQGRRQLGAEARARVLRDFGIDEIVRQYETLYEAALAPSLVAVQA